MLIHRLRQLCFYQVSVMSAALFLFTIFLLQRSSKIKYINTSAANCDPFTTSLNIANSVDPDQTAPLIWMHQYCADGQHQISSARGPVSSTFNQHTKIDCHARLLDNA